MAGGVKVMIMRSGKVVNVLGGVAPNQSAVAKAKEPSRPDKSATDCVGYAIEWPDLDEHIGMEGLLTGRSSGEREASFQKWLANRTAPSTHDGCVAPTVFAKVL
jgi:hypothetical protein